MIPVINDIFFYFATLFAINVIFVSEQSIVTIDLTNKTGQFEYINLKTPLNSIEFAVSGLKKINNATEFDDYFSQLTLTSTKIYKSRNGLNATLKFSFKNKNDLLT